MAGRVDCSSRVSTDAQGYISGERDEKDTTDRPSVEEESRLLYERNVRDPESNSEQPACHDYTYNPPNRLAIKVVDVFCRRCCDHKLTYSMYEDSSDFQGIDPTMIISPCHIREKFLRQTTNGNPRFVSDLRCEDCRIPLLYPYKYGSDVRTPVVFRSYANKCLL